MRVCVCGGGGGRERVRNERMKWDHNDRVKQKREREKSDRLSSHAAILLQGRPCPQYDSSWTQQGHIRTLM